MTGHKANRAKKLFKKYTLLIKIYTKINYFDHHCKLRYTLFSLKL